MNRGLGGQIARRGRRGARRAPALLLAAGPLLAALLLLVARAPVHAQGWGGEERVTATTTDSETGLSKNPIAVDSRGNVHVVWCEQDGPSANYQIYSRRRRIVGWDAAQRAVPYLASYPGSGVGAKYPSLVIDHEDSLHMAWHDYRVAGIENVEIFFKSRGIDSAWDTTGAGDVRLTTSQHPETNGDNGYLPSLVQDGGGLLSVAWYDYRYDGLNAEILFKARVGGVWNLAPGDSADFRVSETAGNSIDPAVAADSSGNVHVVWADQEGGGSILYRRRSAATGAWGAVESVNAGGSAVGSPATAVGAAGALHVLWVDAREGSQAIYARARAAGGGWSAESRVGPSGKNAQEPAIAAGADGSLVAVWHDTRISLLNREVFFQKRPPGDAWDTTGALDFRVSNGTGHSTRPSLLVDRLGDTFVLWKDRRDGNNELYLRIWRNPALTGVAGAHPGDGRALAAGVPRLAAHAVPNPSRGSATIHLAIPAEGRLDLRVYDVAGREVRALWSGLVGAGDLERRWDGADAAGRTLPAGVYLLRATLGRERATTRLVLLQERGR